MSKRPTFNADPVHGPDAAFLHRRSSGAGTHAGVEVATFPKTGALSPSSSPAPPHAPEAAGTAIVLIAGRAATHARAGRVFERWWACPAEALLLEQEVLGRALRRCRDGRAHRQRDREKERSGVGKANHRSSQSRERDINPLRVRRFNTLGPGAVATSARPTRSRRSTPSTTTAETGRHRPVDRRRRGLRTRWFASRLYGIFISRPLHPGRFLMRPSVDR